MSVLIKGMKMPKAGNWKTIRVYYDGTCAEPNWQGDCKVMKGCEAVPIPDHGDLIDRDALQATDSWEWIRHDAPVVIPAERSEDPSHPFADSVMMGDRSEDGKT